MEKKYWITKVYLTVSKKNSAAFPVVFPMKFFEVNRYFGSLIIPDWQISGTTNRKYNLFEGLRLWL